MLNKLLKEKRKKKKGFTLIELVIVIVIIGILSGIGVIAFNSVTDNANESAFRANHKTVVSAVVAVVANNNGVVPADCDDEVDKYLQNTDGTYGLDALEDSPQGATYSVDPDTGEVESVWDDAPGGAMTLTYNPDIDGTTTP